MVATVRCEEIANEKLSHLTSDEVTVLHNSSLVLPFILVLPALSVL